MGIQTDFDVQMETEFPSDIYTELPNTIQVLVHKGVRACNI